MYTQLLHKAAVKAKRIFKTFNQNYWISIEEEYSDILESMRDTNNQLVNSKYRRTKIEKSIIDGILPLFEKAGFKVISEDLYGWSTYIGDQKDQLAYIRTIGGVFNPARKRNILPSYPTLSIVLAKTNENGLYNFSDIFGTLIMNYSNGDILLTEDDQTTVLIENSTYMKGYVKTKPASLNPDAFLLLANLSDYKTRVMISNIEEGLLRSDQWSIESFNSPEFEMACVLTGDADAYFNNVCISSELGAAYLMLKNSGGEILELTSRENLYNHVWLNEEDDDMEIYSIVAAGTNQGANRIADMIDPPKKGKKK